MQISKREITELEAKVLNAIPNGLENATPYYRLKERLNGIDERNFREVIHSLRKKQYPIGAIRYRGGGYFIIRDEEERQQALQGLRNQTESQLELIELMKKMKVGD